MLKLGEDGRESSAEWYFLDDKPVQSFAKTLNVGDYIEPTVEEAPDTKTGGTKKIIRRIKVLKKTTADTPKPAGEWKQKTETRSYTPYGEKSPDTQSSIVRQAVLKAVGAMVGSLSYKSTEDLITSADKIYDHFLAKINVGLFKETETQIAKVTEKQVTLYDSSDPIIP